MFIYKKENQLPIKSWIPEDEYYVDEKMVEQVENLAKLPFAFHHIVLSPDGHVGYGMPIGGVMAAKSVVVPNAVGSDVGCGMVAVKTSLTAIDRSDLKAIMGCIRSKVPVGYHRRTEKQNNWLTDEQKEKLWGWSIIEKEYNSSLKQIGTLGSGKRLLPGRV